MKWMRSLVLGGLGLMGVVAVTSAIWPVVAAVVSVVFTTVIGVAAVVPGVVGARWVRGELAWRRELRTMPPLDATASGAAAAAPTFVELRESA